MVHECWFLGAKNISIYGDTEASNQYFFVRIPQLNVRNGYSKNGSLNIVIKASSDSVKAGLPEPSQLPFTYHYAFWIKSYSPAFLWQIYSR